MGGSGVGLAAAVAVGAGVAEGEGPKMLQASEAITSTVTTTPGFDSGLGDMSRLLRRPRQAEVCKWLSDNDLRRRQNAAPLARPLPKTFSTRLVCTFDRGERPV